MMISFTDLHKKYNIKPTGVFHIGASHGEELAEYLKNGVDRHIWIEAIPAVYHKLVAVLEPYPHSKAICACVSDKIGDKVSFGVTNNDGQSSSMLPMKDHLIHYPTINVVETLQLETTTADKIIEDLGLEMDNYNFLNIDLQGAELLALKGMIKNLPKIKYVYIEVNEQELYEGCPMVSEIDAFLEAYDFEPVDVVMTNAGWGDKFYMKKN